MIKTLIFDFGDVFINLDKKGTIARGKVLFGNDIITEATNSSTLDIYTINNAYEKGLITTEAFVSFYTSLSNDIDYEDVVVLWNSLIQDFPKYRLEFLKTIKNSNRFQLVLLSNTNELHIEAVKRKVVFYEEFKSCFDGFYLSHEIQLRKPDPAIFEFVLAKHNAKAEECLFIDDTKENTDAAKGLGIHVWNIDETREDVTSLFDTKKHLF